MAASQHPRLCSVICVSTVLLLVLFSQALRHRRQQEDRHRRDVLESTEIPAEHIDPAAIDLTPLVNTLINSSQSGSRQLFSLLSVTSYSSLALHKLTLLVYNISSIKSIENSMFRRRFCYCITNETNDLTDFTAILLDVMGNSTSYLHELFKSASILSVSQRNNSDCIYICVMAGKMGREVPELWEVGAITPLFNQTIVEGPHRVGNVSSFRLPVEWHQLPTNLSHISPSGMSSVLTSRVHSTAHVSPTTTVDGTTARITTAQPPATAPQTTTVTLQRQTTTVTPQRQTTTVTPQRQTTTVTPQRQTTTVTPQRQTTTVTPQRQTTTVTPQRQTTTITPQRQTTTVTPQRQTTTVTPQRQTTTVTPQRQTTTVTPQRQTTTVTPQRQTTIVTPQRQTTTVTPQRQTTTVTPQRQTTTVTPQRQTTTVTPQRQTTTVTPQRQTTAYRPETTKAWTTQTVTTQRVTTELLTTQSAVKPTVVTSQSPATEKPTTTAFLQPITTSTQPTTSSPAPRTAHLTTASSKPTTHPPAVSLTRPTAASHHLPRTTTQRTTSTAHPTRLSPFRPTPGPTVARRTTGPLSRRTTTPSKPAETEKPGCPWRRPELSGDSVSSSSSTTTVGAHKLQPCVLELCKFFSQCLCKPFNHKTRMKRYCDDSHLWYEKHTSEVCRRVRRVSFSRNLKQRCLTKMCNKL